MSKSRTKKRRNAYYKYAPKYHKEYVQHTPSVAQPMDSHTTDQIGDSYWVNTYHITAHAMNRYLERVLERSETIQDIKHDEKVKLHLALLSCVPKNFHKLKLSARIKLNAGFTIVIKQGLIITILN